LPFNRRPGFNGGESLGKLDHIERELISALLQFVRLFAHASGGSMMYATSRATFGVFREFGELASAKYSFIGVFTEVVTDFHALP
jgi:hypothetical protein